MLQTHCPHCKGSGITRIHWVKVPLWLPCDCVLEASDSGLNPGEPTPEIPELCLFLR